MVASRLLPGRAKRVATPYLGLVANGCWTPDFLSAPNKQVVSLNRHVVRERVTAIALVYANFYVPSGAAAVEAGSGAAATITARVAKGWGGALLPVTFGGAANGSIPNNGYLVSDFVDIDLDDGDELFDLPLFESTGGVLLVSSAQDYANGEAVKYAASGLSVADLTWGAASADTGYSYKPVAIIGMTTKRTVAIIGDSKNVGYLDRFNDTSGNLGEIARSLGETYACAKFCIGGDSAQEFVASHANRAALANAYASDVSLGFAYNDFVSGRTAAQVVGDLQTIAGYFPGKNVWGQTCAPSSTTSTDWATVAGQTATQAAKVVFNTSMLARPVGFTGVWNVGDAVASGRNTNKWAEDTSLALPKFVTSDGVHPNERGYRRIKDSGVVRL
ncbi:hypothetical protein BH09PSE1_BH09PSE1_08080 [soil metagenome]